MIDYNEYIKKHPRWQQVRMKRFEFDGGRCVICHADLTNEPFQTHHLSYQRLGHERIRDVVTLCNHCHKEFHENWQKVFFWKGKEEGHWKAYDLPNTAQLCAHYWKQDKFISKDPAAANLCNKDAIIQIIDDYFRTFNLTKHPIIDPHDVSMFVRNKRYELFFEAEERGLTVEEFLDEYFGKKVRGKNPIRQEAGKVGGTFDHTPESFHRHYLENPNINVLMEEVQKIEEEEKIKW